MNGSLFERSEQEKDVPPNPCFKLLCDVSECQDRTRAPRPKDTEKNQSLFCRQRDDCYHRNSLFISRALLVEQFSDVMESPCEEKTEETMS